MRKTPAPGAKCQEASPLSHKFYIACGRLATAVIYFPNHKEGPYDMCPMCADHSVRNRGAVYVEDEAPPAGLAAAEGMSQDQRKPRGQQLIPEREKD